MRFAVLALALAVHVDALCAEWQSTDVSAFTFEVNFEGEPIGGEFRAFEVCFDYDPDAPADAHLVVTVDLSAADMGDPDMNAVLFDQEWLDVAEFGTAVFESFGVDTQPSGGITAAGRLSLKGTDGEVTVPFTWRETERTASMTGALALTRTDFGVGTGEWASDDVVDLEVRLDFDIVLERAE